MSAAAEITAAFNTGNGPTATVTTTLSGAGRGSVAVDNSRCQDFDPAQFSACTTTYLLGSVVSLGAAAAAGSRFSGFSSGSGGGEACGFAAVCTFTLSGDATLTASFHAITALAVTPQFVALAIGSGSKALVATGTYTDGVSEPVLPGPGTWVTGPILPTSRYGLGAAGIDTKLYAIGGIENGEPSQTVSVLAGSWSAAPPLLFARAGFATVSSEVHRTVWVMGGNTAGSTVTSTVESYFPNASTWTQRQSLLTPRRYLAGGYWWQTGTLYAVGGEAVTDGVATVVGTLEASLGGDTTWVTKAPMPTPRKHLAAAVTTGFLYAIGGTDANGTPLATVEAYDLASNTWSARAPMPAAMATPVATVAAFTDSAIYVMGATASDPAAMFEYDTAANVWTVKSSMPTARNGFAAAGVNGIVYTVGGILPTSLPSGKVEAFTDSIRWGSIVLTGAMRLTQQGVVSALSRFSDLARAVAGTVSCTVNFKSPSTCASVSTLEPLPTEMSLDSPANNSTIATPFVVQGWALTRAATSGTGVDAVHVYAIPRSGSGTIFLGTATYGLARPDVGAAFGAQFTNSGFRLTVTGSMLPPGPYTIQAHPHNAVINAFDGTKSADIIVSAPVTNPAANVDWPVAGATLTSAFEVGGWAIDQGASSGTGIDAVEFYVQPTGTPAPGVFVGTGSYGIARSDVGGLFGAQFTNSGFHFTITGLGPGSYTLAVRAHSTVAGAYSIVKTVPFTVNGMQLMSIDAPSPEATVTGLNFAVSGWSIDRAVATGTGVDSLHIYAYPNPGSGQAPIFLGVATVGIQRLDVAALYGARFTSSGYDLAVNRTALGLTPGVYNIAVHSHSTSGTFNNLAVVRVTLQ
jgi:hypothetical protein